jgi:hypothetical protein
MFRRIALSLLILAITAPALAAEQAPKTLRVCFVGNSVTDTIKYGALAELAKSRGYKQVWGRHMIPGAPLQWIWEHPKDGFQEPPFGHYPTALANFQWDVLSLQPFDRHLERNPSSSLQESRCRFRQSNPSSGPPRTAPL